MEAKRLLSTILAVPSWRCSLNLDSDEALSLTTLLLKEEAIALSQAADGPAMTKVTAPSDFVLCQLFSLSAEFSGS